MGTTTRSIRRLSRGFSYVAGILLVLAVWEIYARLRPSIFIPPFSDVVLTFKDVWLASDPGRLFLGQDFWDQGLVSIQRVLIGWLIACVVGTVAGIVIGGSRVIEALFAFPVRFGVATPSSALLPVALGFFGITNNMNISLIALGAVWPVLLNTIDGVRGIEGTARLTAKSMRLSRLRTFTTILLPGASPQIFAGMRVSMGIALVLMVVSELYAATRGIGYYLTLSSRTFQYPQMWSAVLLIALIGMVANGLFALGERRVLSWHRLREGHGRAQ